MSGARGLHGALGMRCPIIGAPMAGGPTTPALVAAVSEAGGLGTLAAGYLPPCRLRSDLIEVRRRTSRPFSVNLFVPSDTEERQPSGELEQVLEALGAEVGSDSGFSPTPLPSFDEQMAVTLEDPPVLVTFTFGVPAPDVVDALHDAGCLVGATATTVAEASVLETAGVDVVCAQGYEAGGHRGGFLGGSGGGLVGSMALVPQVVDAVEVPVVAAGGIADGRGVAAVLALGAVAAQVGTALLACPEAGTAPGHRRRLGLVPAEDLVLTDRVTGKVVRALRNRLTAALESVEPLPFPQMHRWTAELRRIAASRDDDDLMGMWAGQAGSLAAARPAGEVVADMAATAMRLMRG